MTDTWDGITANLLNKSEKLAYVVMLHDSQHFFLKWVTVRIDTSASGRSRSTLPGSQPQKMADSCFAELTTGGENWGR